MKKFHTLVAVPLFAAMAVAQKPENWFDVSKWVPQDSLLGPVSTFMNVGAPVEEDGFRGFQLRRVYQNPVLNDDGWKEKTVFYVVEINCDSNELRSKRVSFVDVNGASHRGNDQWSKTGDFAAKDMASLVKNIACKDAKGRYLSKLTVYDSPGFQVTFDLRRGESLSFATLEGNPKTYSITAPKVVFDADHNVWTETISFTDFPSDVTDEQIDFTISQAKAWLEAVTRCDPDGTCADHVRILEYRKQHVSVNRFYFGWEFTWSASWPEDTDCYYRVFAVNNRLYQMIVLTGAHEDPDEANPNKAESLRFFDSFLLKRGK